MTHEQRVKRLLAAARYSENYAHDLDSRHHKDWAAEFNFPQEETDEMKADALKHASRMREKAKSLQEKYHKSNQKHES